MKPFRIDVPQEKLDHIRDRVASYRWFPAPDDEGSTWRRGVNTAALKEICDYWVDTYDWRRSEEELNRYPQFIAEVDGLDIHVVKVEGESGGRRPLLLTHGWPGSHYEFWGAIDRLAFPSRHGGRPEDAFDLVIPTLPGFGFSGSPGRPIGPRRTAVILDALMTETLGFDRYLAQGGDWGALITSWLGLEHEASVAGIHINMVGFFPRPPVDLTQEEMDWVALTQGNMWSEGAYFLQQAAKPKTVAAGLMDSPVGVAAWILEKFYNWSDLEDGRLESSFTKDQLLTNLMIYLVTDSFATSIWYYGALYEETEFVMLPVEIPEGQFCKTPTAFANFPAEVLYPNPPRAFAERVYNVARYTNMAAGGHFGAMEQPSLFVEDVVAFSQQIGY